MTKPCIWGFWPIKEVDFYENLVYALRGHSAPKLCAREPSFSDRALILGLKARNHSLLLIYKHKIYNFLYFIH